MNQISELVQTIDLSEFDRLPNLHSGSKILIGSDYGGHHSSSAYEVISFLLADIQHSLRWMSERRQLRLTRLRDNRRFSFKSLGDRIRSRALPSFLAAGNQIPGLLVTVLINKRIDSMFKLVGRISASDPELSEFPGWKPAVMERLLRVVHFISLFLSGLSRSSQDVLWVSDEDAIAPNELKHRELVKIFGHICSQYLAHDLGHIRVSTTASDTGKRDVEDFVALSDFAAGALAEIITLYDRAGTLATGVTVPPVNGCSQKTLEIMNWLSDSRVALKKLSFGIDPIPGSTALKLRLLDFASTSGRTPLR